MPDEVLGLIYAQTVVWVGSFFCPLLPLLNLAKFLLLFYMKKVRGWESTWVLREKGPKNQFALVGRARALEWGDEESLEGSQILSVPSLLLPSSPSSPPALRPPAPFGPQRQIFSSRWCFSWAWPSLPSRCCIASFCKCLGEHLPSPPESEESLTVLDVPCSGRRIPPSKLCGPFRWQPSIWNQIPELILNLPQPTQNFLFFLGTQAFAVPLLLISR